MLSTYARPLKAGDTIGLITPSSPLVAARLKAGITYLEQKGFKVKLGNHLHDTNRFLAGQDEDRAKDLMDFFLDKDVKAIMATGGGYGSQRILPFLDYDLIRANPKMTTGASDSTSLQLGLLKQAGIVSYAGFIFGELDTGTCDPLIENTLFACLKGESYSISEGKIVHPGIAKGILIGGNLECLTALMGTPYQPDFQDTILFIEDVGAEPYQVDSRISQLDLAGVFKQVAGVLFCSFARCAAQ